MIVTLSCMQTLSLFLSTRDIGSVLYVHNSVFKKVAEGDPLPCLKLMNHGETTYMHVN